MADDGDASTPELILVGVPGLDDAGLALYAVCGLERVEAVELALVLLPSPEALVPWPDDRVSWLGLLGCYEAPIYHHQKGNGEGEQQNARRRRRRRRVVSHL